MLLDPGVIRSGRRDRLIPAGSHGLDGIVLARCNSFAHTATSEVGVYKGRYPARQASAWPLDEAAFGWLFPCFTTMSAPRATFATMSCKGILPGLVAVATALASISAVAQEPRPLSTWLQTCQELQVSQGGDIRLTVEHGLPGLAVIGIHSPGSKDKARIHKIELTHPPRQPFVTENGVGLSPVGEFPSWANAPARMRSGLDLLIACSRELGAPVLSSVSGNLKRELPTGSGGAPWRFLLASILAAVALGSFRRRRPGLESAPTMSAKQSFDAADIAALLLIPATFLFRLFTVPVAYLHQNGQGPLWVDFALGAPSSYGPGFPQLYRWLLSRTSDPDEVLFDVHALAGAVIPFLLYVMARFAGAGRVVSLVLSIAAATSPAFARVAQSESYFAAILILLVSAGAVLAASASPRQGWWRFGVGIVAAGLFVSQAALVHPLGWLPASLLPLCTFFVPGPLLSRVVRTGLAGLGIALVVVATSGPMLLEILGGELGQRWTGSSGPSLVLLDRVWLVAAVIVLLSPLLWPRAKAVAPAFATALAVLAVAFGSGTVLSQTTPAIRAAHALLFAPVLTSALAAGLRTLRGPALWATAAIALALAAGIHVRTWNPVTELPTDALEGQLALEWRMLVPEGSRVSVVSRAGQYVVTLPLRAPGHAVSSLRVPRESDTASLPMLGEGSFYYRPALCSTDAAREYCDRLESAHRLEPLWNATLPSRPSISNLVFDEPQVQVALFRVKGVAEELANDGEEQESTALVGVE